MLKVKSTTTAVPSDTGSSSSSSGGSTALAPFTPCPCPTTPEEAFTTLWYIGSKEHPVDITEACSGEFRCRGCGDFLLYGSCSYSWYCKCYLFGTPQFPVSETVAVTGEKSESFDPPLPVSPKSISSLRRTCCMKCRKPLGPKDVDDEEICTCHLANDVDRT